MENTEILLQSTYEASVEGAAGIGAILPKTQDPEMRKILVSALAGYDDLSHRTAEELIRRGKRAKEHPLSEMIKTFSIHTRLSSSPRNGELARVGAEFLSEVKEKARKELERLPDASPAAAVLAGQCIRLSRNTQEQLRSF